jgi:hypothetical protein
MRRKLKERVVVFVVASDAAIASQFHVANEHQFPLSHGFKHAEETECVENIALFERPTTIRHKLASPYYIIRE